MKVSQSELQIRLAWSLNMKIEYFIKRYCEFMIAMNGECYVSFSGGKDSQVGDDIIERVHDGRFSHLIPRGMERVLKFKRPVKAFANTGLEFPEIVEHVKSFKDVKVLKPRMGFTRVIKEVGVAVGSKKIARMIRDLQNPTDANKATRRLYLTGLKRDGTKTKSFKLPTLWHPLIDAPFKVSDKCCDIFKKEPFRKFESSTGLKPIVFTTVEESNQRKASYQQTGCNSFEEGKEKSRPMSIFTEKDVWEYHDVFGLRFSEVYYKRTLPVKQLDGTVVTVELEAEERTGCTFCLFGIHLEKKGKNNRIQRLAISHPQYWDIVVNKCGLSKVLRFIGVPYQPLVQCGKQSSLF